jgi:circadian clock protein KaiB
MSKPSHSNGNGTGKVVHKNGKEMAGSDVFKFRLYIAGDAPNSVQAVANLNALCRKHLPERHIIEIVDVILEPKRALADGILLTPTLVKFLPLPVRKIVGNLGQTQTVLDALGLVN